MLFSGHNCQPCRRTVPEWEAGFRGLRTPIGCGAHWILPKRTPAAAPSSSRLLHGSLPSAERQRVENRPAALRNEDLLQQEDSVIKSRPGYGVWQPLVEKHDNKKGKTVRVKLHNGQTCEKRPTDWKLALLK
ncbi:unnamed protein product [Amoebophrya sp. A120]|nr:unnamed protein product [Amoebophrya sp. A120]|eukprot:GSA120T00009073001.1